MVTRRRRLLLQASAAVVFTSCSVLTACTWGDESPSKAAKDAPTAAIPLPPLRTVFTGDLAGIQSLPWDDAHVVSETQLDVLYVGSPVGCRQLANVRVAEATDRVTITVFEGQVQSSVNEVCRAIGENARVRVTLTQPLGQRRLFDGSTNPPTERQLVR